MADVDEVYQRPRKKRAEYVDVADMIRQKVSSYTPTNTP